MLIKLDVRRRCKLLVIFPAIVIIILTITYSSLTNHRKEFEEGKKRAFKKDEVLQVVHLDLKGAAPKMSYLIDLIPRLVSAGVTGLLVEYEDMFPYEGYLRNISSTVPYSKLEISRFVQYCADLNIEIIPLVQTFGHMEYVLKLEEFRNLRETPFDPRSICPSNHLSIRLIRDMVEQVLALHQFSKRIHIGCDEVYVINVCSRCAEKEKSTSEIFFHHVRETATFIAERYNHTITTLIWDDMLRWKPHYLIKQSNLTEYVEIMIWDYTAEIQEQIRHRVWQKYSSIFPRIWLAGAFKGADGPKSMLPSIKTRFYNHKSWMLFMERATSSIQIVGFVSTGWSRYDHFASLCELLPASIPSLILTSLKTASGLNPSRNYIDDYNGILRCRINQKEHPAVESSLQHMFDLSHIRYCDIREARLIFGLLQLEQLQHRIRQMYDDIFFSSGWVSEYHLKNGLLGGRVVRDEFENRAFNATNTWFLQIYAMLKRELNVYYSEKTVEEWMETYVEPYAAKLKKLKSIQENATSINVWSRRDS